MAARSALKSRFIFATASVTCGTFLFDRKIQKVEVALVKLCFIASARNISQPKATFPSSLMICFAETIRQAIYIVILTVSLSLRASDRASEQFLIIITIIEAEHNHRIDHGTNTIELLRRYCHYFVYLRILMDIRDRL